MYKPTSMILISVLFSTGLYAQSSMPDQCQQNETPGSNMPGMPDFDGMPGMPGMPDFDGMPGMPGMPDFDGMPGMPGDVAMPGPVVCKDQIDSAYCDINEVTSGLVGPFQRGSIPRTRHYGTDERRYTFSYLSPSMQANYDRDLALREVFTRNISVEVNRKFVLRIPVQQRLYLGSKTQWLEIYRVDGTIYYQHFYQGQMEDAQRIVLEAYNYIAINPVGYSIFEPYDFSKPAGFVVRNIGESVLEIEFKYSEFNEPIVAEDEFQTAGNFCDLSQGVESPSNLIGNYVTIDAHLHNNPNHFFAAKIDSDGNTIDQADKLVDYLVRANLSLPVERTNDWFFHSGLKDGETYIAGLIFNGNVVTLTEFRFRNGRVTITEYNRNGYTGEFEARVLRNDVGINSRGIGHRMFSMAIDPVQFFQAQVIEDSSNGISLRLNVHR